MLDQNIHYSQKKLKPNHTGTCLYKNTTLTCSYGGKEEKFKTGEQRRDLLPDLSQTTKAASHWGKEKDDIWDVFLLIAQTRYMNSWTKIIWILEDFILSLKTIRLQIAFNIGDRKKQAPLSMFRGAMRGWERVWENKIIFLLAPVSCMLMPEL